MSGTIAQRFLGEDVMIVLEWDNDAVDEHGTLVDLDQLGVLIQDRSTKILNYYPWASIKRLAVEGRRNE